MKSFLLKGKKPLISWGLQKDNTFYEGKVPDGYKLAVNPSKGFIVIDVDRHGKIDGFDNIPQHLKEELSNTFHYDTKNNGMHYWFKYTGNRPLANKASNLGIDLRVGPSNGNNGGYAVYYSNNDIREQLHLIKDSSKELNVWLESIFSYKNKDGNTKKIKG